MRRRKRRRRRRRTEAPRPRLEECNGLLRGGKRAGCGVDNASVKVSIVSHHGNPDPTVYRCHLPLKRLRFCSLREVYYFSETHNVGRRLLCSLLEFWWLKSTALGVEGDHGYSVVTEVWSDAMGEHQGISRWGRAAWSSYRLRIFLDA